MRVAGTRGIRHHNAGEEKIAPQPGRGQSFKLRRTSIGRILLDACSNGSHECLDPQVVARDHVVGRTAPKSPVEYGSYDCPDCVGQCAHHQVRDQLGERVRFTYFATGRFR